MRILLAIKNIQKALTSRIPTESSRSLSANPRHCPDTIDKIHAAKKPKRRVPKLSSMMAMSIFNMWRVAEQVATTGAKSKYASWLSKPFYRPHSHAAQAALPNNMDDWRRQHAREAKKRIMAFVRAKSRVRKILQTWRPLDVSQDAPVH